MKKSLLILGAGIESVEGYLKIKKFNCKIIVVDKNPKAPGVKYADIYIRSSIKNFKEILKKLLQKKIKIDGVLSFGDVSYVANRLSKYFKTESIPLKSAKITSDKFLFKSEMKNYLNIPFFKKIRNLKQLKEIISKKKNNFILKPVDNSGARGIIIINKYTDLSWAYEYCKKYSKKNYFIIEEFISGPQLSTEGIVYKGKYIHLCSFDRNYEMISKYKPFIIENGGSTPSKIGEKNKKKIFQILSKITKKLNLYNATIKGDLIIKKNKIYVIEIATRLSGGWLSTITIPNSTGVDILGYTIKNSLKIAIKEKELIPRFEKKIIQRYLFPRVGKINSIKFKNKSLLSNKDILSFKIFVKKGQIIEKIDSHGSRIGHVIVRNSNLKKGILHANKILKNVEIKYS